MQRWFARILVFALGLVFVGFAAQAAEPEFFVAETSQTAAVGADCPTPELFAPPAEERLPPRPNPQWCGDPCPAAGQESYCTGYRCSGVIAKGACVCQQGLFQLVWTCGWAC